METHRFNQPIVGTKESTQRLLSHLRASGYIHEEITEAELDHIERQLENFAIDAIRKDRTICATTGN